MQRLILILALMSTACSKAPPQKYEMSEAEKQAYAQRFVDDAQKIREVIARELPGIENDDDFQKSVRVRNLIQHRNRIGIYTAPWGDLNQPLLNLEKTLAGEWRHSCAGMSFTFQTVMFAFGIKTRYVGLADGVYAVRTHAVAEIEIDGKWIAVDTTYNNTYVDQSGNYLSFREMREMRDRGETFVVEMNGQAPVDIWNPVESDVGMNTYLNLLAEFPAFDQPQVESYLPATWNGWVEVPGQGPCRMFLVDFYEYLNRAYRLQSEVIQ